MAESWRKPLPDFRDLTLEPADNERLANLCGEFDQHLRQVEQRLSININNRGNHFQLIGDAQAVDTAAAVILSLHDETLRRPLNPKRVHLALQEATAGTHNDRGQNGADVVIQTRHGRIRGRGPNQRQYLFRIQRNDLNFGIGPAGTGKTYLAVASAVEALERGVVRRLVLVRPAVEAGERLGFLPGDLTQKVDPYLRPIYDALYEMLGFEKVGRLIERQIIEVAPLAYMRGRTLNEAFVILDEAQNTTIEQMKMFLTRIGFGSRTVVNGDVTQTDLPAKQRSGLGDALDVLKDVEGIGYTFFTAHDIVRHALVQRIVTAYERAGDR